MLASFGAQVVASRALGPKGYGVYGLVISNVAVVGSLLSPGLSGALAAFLAEQDAQKSSKGMLSVISAGIGIEVLTALLFVSICSIFGHSITNHFFNGSSVLSSFFLILVILQGFYGVIAGGVQGFRELKTLASARVVQQVSLLLLMFLVVQKLSLPVESALLVHSVSLGLPLLMCSASIVFSVRDRLKTLVSDTRFWKYTGGWKEEVPVIVQFAVPASVAAAATSLIQSSGPAVINYLSNDNPDSQLGFLVVILNLARPFNRLVQTTIRSAFPYLVYWNADGSSQKIRRYTILVTLAVGGGYVLLAAVALVLGRELISIAYGPDYLPVARYLPWALLTFGTISLQDVYRVLLFSLKRTGLFLLVNIIGLGIFALSIVLGIRLIQTPDSILLLLFSMGSANIIIAIGALLLFQRRLASA